MNRIVVASVIGGAITTGMVGVAYALASAEPDAGRAMNSRAPLQSRLDSMLAATRPQWRGLPAPAGSHVVPIVDMTRTTFWGSGLDDSAARAKVREWGRATAANPLAANQVKGIVRDALSRAGVDWDWRVILDLWGQETGMTLHAWNWNLGNIKARSFMYADREMIARRETNVSLPSCTNVWIVQGSQETAVEPYLGFASLEHYVRYAARLFDSGYPAAADALRRGGLDGVRAFNDGLVNGAGGREYHGRRPGFSRSQESLYQQSRAARLWQSRATRLGPEVWAR